MVRLEYTCGPLMNIVSERRSVSVRQPSHSLDAHMPPET